MELDIEFNFHMCESTGLFSIFVSEYLIGNAKLYDSFGFLRLGLGF